MAVENALSVGGAAHQPPNEITRLMRNIILGAEFVMSHITHFYALAALSYVQGPSVPPWTPYFDNSYYHSLLQAPATGLPSMAKQNVTGDNYTGTDGIWDNVILDYVTALKYRRDAANASAILGGRTPMIQNGCLVGGCAHKPSADDLDKVKGLINGCLGFINSHQIPLTHILSYLYPTYDNGGSNPASGWGCGSASGGAQRVLAWGVFDLSSASGDDPNRLLKRGCYEWSGSAMSAVLTPSTLWDNVREYIDNSKYASATALKREDGTFYKDPSNGLHPCSGYTNPASGNGYSWAKSPRIVEGSTARACQVGPLARMAVHGERVSGVSADPEYAHYRINTTKPCRANDHAYLGYILDSNGLDLTGVNFLCGFSTMDRHRARAYEAAKIARAIAVDDGDGSGKGWCDQLKDYLTANPTASAFTTWTAPGNGSYHTGYGAHEAPRGALAHFVEVLDGKISNYQAVVPTTWNVNPEAPNNVHGPIEDAVIGTAISGTASSGHDVPVEALRVVQGFDPCIACTVH